MGREEWALVFFLYIFFIWLVFFSFFCFIYGRWEVFSLGSSFIGVVWFSSMGGCFFVFYWGLVFIFLIGMYVFGKVWGSCNELGV